MSFRILYSEIYKLKKKRLHREFKCGVLHGKTSPVRFVINEMNANRIALLNFLNC